MNLSLLSIAALPAAGALTRQAAQAGMQVGGSFADALSRLGDALVPNEPAQDTSALKASEASDEQATSGNSDSKTKSWSRDFIRWLGERVDISSTKIQLSLNELDQPTISIEGDEQAIKEIQQALDNDPTWMQQFRELALDQASQRGWASAPQVSGPVSGAIAGQATYKPMTLSISTEKNNVEATWT